MYSIQTTPGFIIDSRPAGEAGKLLSIFTRDLGLVLASAQGIRLEKSKLRYHTLDYSFGTFSFVRGKEFWRLTSAQAGRARGEGKGKPFGSESLRLEEESQRQNEFFARMALLLRRLLHGEEPHPELFEILESTQQFLAESDITDEQMKALESLVVLRILHSLGYVGNDQQLIPYTATHEITSELLYECLKVRTVLNQHINRALKESHL